MYIYYMLFENIFSERVELTIFTVIADWAFHCNSLVFVFGLTDGCDLSFVSFSVRRIILSIFKIKVSCWVYFYRSYFSNINFYCLLTPCLVFYIFVVWQKCWMFQIPFIHLLPTCLVWFIDIIFQKCRSMFHFTDIWIIINRSQTDFS